LSKSIRTWSFDRYRFAEANPIRSFFYSHTGERYIYVNETLRWQPRENRGVECRGFSNNRGGFGGNRSSNNGRRSEPRW
jgi:hypothetical protein